MDCLRSAIQDLNTVSCNTRSPREYTKNIITAGLGILLDWRRKVSLAPPIVALPLDRTARTSIPSFPDPAHKIREDVW